MNNAENKPDPRMVRFRDIGVNNLFRSYRTDNSPGDIVYRKTGEDIAVSTEDKTGVRYPILSTSWVYPCDDQGTISGDSKP